MLKTAKFSEDR